MTIRFSYCHKPPTAYHRSFFEVKYLVFTVVYVIGLVGGDEVPELGVFVMGLGRY